VENLAHCIPPVPEDHIRKLATGIEIYSPTKATYQVKSASTMRPTGC
jgi:hypothetical protein